MRRNGARKNFAARQTSRQKNVGQVRGRWVLLIAVVAVIACGMGFYIFQYKPQSQGSVLTAAFTRTTAWFNERRKHFQAQKEISQQNSAPAKHLTATKNNVQQPIHFEFYTALPKMQMNLPEPAVKIVTKPSIAEVTKPVVPVANVPIPKVIIADAAQLEKELAAEIKQSTYIIQLGIFRTLAAAAQYQKTLSGVGTEVNIVKTAMAQKKIFFRVQLGPYRNKNQAKLTQRQLQKKGISGIVKLVS